jgi:RNA polymerase primary sigma factor
MRLIYYLPIYLISLKMPSATYSPNSEYSLIEKLTLDSTKINDLEILAERMKHKIKANGLPTPIKLRGTNYQPKDLVESLNLKSIKEAHLIMEKGYLRYRKGKIMPRDIKKFQDVLLEKLGIQSTKKIKKKLDSGEVYVPSNGNNYKNSLELYLNQTNFSQPLTREQEKKLAAKIKKGDKKSRDILVEANLRFVVDIAKKYQTIGLPLEELVSAGNLGLINAAERFDGTRGYKFISYAVWWIKQGILQTAAENARTVRLPSNRIAEIIKLNRVIQETNETTNLEEVAKKLKISLKDVENTLLIAQETTSLDKEIEKDSSDTLVNILQDKSQENPEQYNLNKSLKEELKNSIKALEKDEKIVIELYFGLKNEGSMTLEEIGIYLGKTRERARQIREKALTKLRNPAKSKNLKQYLQE